MTHTLRIGLFLLLWVATLCTRAAADVWFTVGEDYPSGSMGILDSPGVIAVSEQRQHSELRAPVSSVRTGFERGRMFLHRQSSPE